MGFVKGDFELGPATGELLVKTTRTGLGAKAGHDLALEVTRWKAEVSVDPADLARSSVSLTADTDSLRVRSGEGGLKPLTDSDRAEIEKNIAGKILNHPRQPAIAFRSSQVSGTPESFTIDGELTIGGTSGPVTVTGQWAGERVQGSATVTQSRWGIKPFSAMLGALRLSDDVEIEFSATIGAS